jgi:peptidoglycan hydrolase CwlO-like protein
MTLKAVLTLTALVATTWPLLAQTQPTPQSPQEQLQFYQRAVGVLQAQRNKAEDDVAQATAQAQSWKEQLDRAQGEIRTLQDRLAASQPPAAPVPPPNVPGAK